jgi:hypothetical protein
MSVNKYEIIALDRGGVTVDNSGNIIPVKDNGTVLDTYGDIDVSINYQIDDILDITKRNTTWTKTITLPGTPENNKFFKHIYDVNIDNVTFNPVKRIPVLIRIGTNDVLKGFMQLMNVVIDNKKVDYDVSIAGSFRNIIATISDYSLGQIDLKEYNHTRTQEAVVESWDYNVYFNDTVTSFNEPGKGYVYPHIVNGNSQDIWDKTYVYDLFPAIYAKTIIDKFTATNTSAGTETISVNLVSSGGSAGNSNLIVKTKAIAPNQTYTFPELVGQVLESGGFISTLPSAATSLTIMASGREIT